MLNMCMWKIYTDGAYSMSRDRGGYAFIVFENEIPTKKYHKSLIKSTNQRAEVLAVINAFRYIIAHEDMENVEIVTDSMYVVGTTCQGWKTKTNLDLWGIYFYLHKKVKDKVKFTHVRGHKGIFGNELADIFSVIASEGVDTWQRK